MASRKKKAPFLSIGHGHRIRQLKKLVRKPAFAKKYLYFSVAVLLLTTVLWSYMGARLQAGNADQLIGPYLFDSRAAFHGADFPSAHTFLLKWPVFLLIKLLGFPGAGFVIVTMVLSLLTVGAFMFVLSRIERRPLVLGTISLALSSALLLVPPAPYSGGLLPVSMAMLTTRNIEYVLYIAALALIVRARRLASWQFCTAVVVLALLIASDKIFLVMSGGGALLALVVYGWRNQWRLVTFSVYWLLGSVAAMVLAFVGLLVIKSGHVTYIGGGTSPYALVSGVSNFALALVYGLAGLLTNFGANPAFSATWVRAIPHEFITRLATPSGPAYIINLAVVIICLLYAWRLIRPSFGAKTLAASHLDEPTKLSVALLWSGLVALLAFVATDHYYAVDARYLTVLFFALFVAATTRIRKKTWPPEVVGIAGLVLLSAVILGAVGAVSTYGDQKAALADVNERNETVAQVLEQHHVDTLVGDYWRVLPAKEASHNRIDVTPLGGCTQPRDVLSTSAWQPDLRHHSFAYLLSLDRSLTGYPSCEARQVVAAYGQPNASVVIAGSLAHPKELLLFYDHGEQPPEKLSATASSLISPVDIASLPDTTCRVPTVMNIVAHQDDDLLFMNPDLLTSIRKGDCVRTVYVTAGDAGFGKFYWLGREQGSEAAYARMLGIANRWVQRTIALAGHEYATISSPVGNPGISLIFLHLPDGNLSGQGFRTSHYESLHSLQAGSISRIHSVDGQSVYSYSRLETALASLLFAYEPNEVRTQATFVSDQAPDHSDHMAVSLLTQAAYTVYNQEHFGRPDAIPITHYIGYPIQTFPVNISGADLANKEATFFTYAKYDRGVCTSLQKCEAMTYGAYLDRQYTE